MSRHRRLQTEDVGDVTVVMLNDKKILDEQNIEVVGEQLFALVDELHRHCMILDFAGVEYLSSAAVGKFLTLNKKVEQAGGKLVFCNIDEQIMSAIRTMKFDLFFTIVKNRQDAIDAFGALPKNN